MTSLELVIVSPKNFQNRRCFSGIYDKQDQQGKAALNERNPTWPSNKNKCEGAQAGPKQNTGQGNRQSTDRLITKMINNL
jgi:hypothetical protein